MADISACRTTVQYEARLVVVAIFDLNDGLFVIGIGVFAIHSASRVVAFRLVRFLIAFLAGVFDAFRIVDAFAVLAIDIAIDQ